MLCNRIDELSIKYIENQLDDQIKREFEDHISNCNKCKSKYNEIKSNYDVSFKPVSDIDLRFSVMNKIKALNTPNKKIDKHKFKLIPLITGFAEVLVVVLVMFLIPVIVKQTNQPNEVILSKSLSPEEFLITNDLTIQGRPEVLEVDVPKVWDVKLGDYPIGLYWRLANEFSKDAGLDLTPLKGKTVEAWRYALLEGLPGQGEQSQFKYPSDIILLVEDKKVVGAWLNFNKWSIGPSIKKHYLKDITGLAYEEWIVREGLFSSVGKNADIASLDPVNLLNEFFKAINEGDKNRAYACLSPIEMRDSLSMNLEKDHLYNSGFNQDNSIVENIIKANPISYKLMDPHDFPEIQKVEDRTEIEIAVTLDIQWRDNVFNSPDGTEIRFAILKKYQNGWKLEGLGTGP